MQIPQENKPDSGEDSDVMEIQPEEPVKVLEMQGTFDEIVNGRTEELLADDCVLMPESFRSCHRATTRRTSITSPASHGGRGIWKGRESTCDQTYVNADLLWT